MKQTDLKQLIKEAILEALIAFSTPALLSENDELKEDDGSNTGSGNGGNTNPGDSIPGGLGDTIPNRPPLEDPIPLPTPGPVIGPVGF